MPRVARPVALIGLPGSGKSTVGRRLAARLGVPFRDLDAEIESAAGASVAALFEREGESGFRRREQAVLASLSGETPGVVACGGGIVVDAASREILKQRFLTVWLEIDPAEAAERLSTGAATRPLLRDRPLEPRLASLLEEREAWYRECSVLRVRTDRMEPDQVVTPVVAFLEGPE